MKNWEKPAIENMDLSRTMFGGDNQRKVDIVWTDEYDNENEEYLS